MKTKNIISALLAFAVCFAMSGCDKNGGSSESVPDSDVSGTYVTLEGFRSLGNEPKKLVTDYDRAIKESHEYIASSKDSELERLGKLSLMSALTLDENGGFTAYYQPATGTDIEFTGSYKTDGGKLSFEYKHEKRTVTMEQLDELETPKISEADAGSDELFGKNMELLNTVGEGTYLQYAAPMWFAADYLKFDMCVMPMPMGMRGFSQCPIQMDEKVLKEAKRQYFTVHNGVLCADTAGWELEGEYKKGESFNVKFDPMAAADDWYLYKDETADDKKSMFSSLLKTDKPTEIKFSSGKWEWINADGETMNTGGYTESSEIDGLFCMYTDDDSAHGISGEVYQFIYINGSDIYYPYAFRA